MTGYVHPQLHEEIVERLKLELEAANVQARFWRQAAEHAVDGWNALEDKHEHLRELVATLLKSEPQDPDAAVWFQLEALVKKDDDAQTP